MEKNWTSYFIPAGLKGFTFTYYQYLVATRPLYNEVNNIEEILGGLDYSRLPCDAVGI